MRIHVSGGLTLPVERAVARVVAELGPGVEALPGTLVIGADDPMIPEADVQRPLAVVPAHGPGRVTPWGAALVAAADAVILLDPSEVHASGDALVQRPVVMASLPAPAPLAPGTGLDWEDAPRQVRRAWLREASTPAPSTAGVAWVWGRGIAPLAASLEAWAAGRAVVALPQTEDHELLRRGRALRAQSAAEAVEATRFLLDNPPLAQALGARGREVASRLPSCGRVALWMLEGLELARQSASTAAR